MIFKKKRRGYDPAQVDKYIEETAESERKIRTAQKERIDELTDENYALRQQLKQYQTDEQAISKSLIASQQLAAEMKFDAEKYSDLVLSRAKIFYATWRAYAQTLISSLSPEEVAQFNTLQRKIEEIINAYEGKDVAKEMELRQTNAAAATAKRTSPVDVTPTQTTMGALSNPISKVEQAADQAIDLRELVRPDLSLEELCVQLGLTPRKDDE